MAGNVELSHGQTSLKFGGILGGVALAVIVLGTGIGAVAYQNAKILELLLDARIVQAQIEKRQFRIAELATQNARDLQFIMGTLFPRDRPRIATPPHHSGQ